jgi:hypothetical protein
MAIVHVQYMSGKTRLIDGMLTLLVAVTAEVVVFLCLQLCETV